MALTRWLWCSTNMPDMHGLAVVTFVRKHERYREIPILVLTPAGMTSRAAYRAAGPPFTYPPFTLMPRRAYPAAPKL